MDTEIPGDRLSREECLDAIANRLSRASDEHLEKILLTLQGQGQRRRAPDTGTDRTPVAYGYCRISRLSDEDESLGIDSQKRHIREAFEKRFQAEGFTWGGYFVDPDTSGGTSLDDREAGRSLCLRVLPGDLVICLDSDRLFRSIGNSATQLKAWADRGIDTYFVRKGLLFTSRDMMGQMAIHFFCMFADYERQMISVRCREAKAQAKAQGKVYTPHIPPGFKLVGAPGSRRRVVDWQQQETIDAIVELRDSKNLPWRSIALKLEREGVKYDYVAKRLKSGGYLHAQRSWSVRRCFVAYHARKRDGRPAQEPPCAA